MRALQSSSHGIRPSLSRSGNCVKGPEGEMPVPKSSLRYMYYSTLTARRSRATVCIRAGHGIKEIPPRRRTDAGGVGIEGQRLPRIRQLHRTWEAATNGCHFRATLQSHEYISAGRSCTILEPSWRCLHNKEIRMKTCLRVPHRMARFGRSTFAVFIGLSEFVYWSRLRIETSDFHRSKCTARKRPRDPS